MIVHADTPYQDNAADRPALRKIIAEKKPVPADPALREMIMRIDRGDRKLHLAELRGSARAMIPAILAQTLDRTIMVVCPTERAAKEFHQDLVFFLGEDCVFHYPSDALSVDLFAYERDVELRRMEILGRLLLAEKLIVVAPLRALMRRVAPQPVLDAFCRVISLGDMLERDELVMTLQEGGYTRVVLVEAPGEFSLRGHVIDVFPPTSRAPLRMELVGDELESIRTFDPLTQRSTGELAEFILTPAAEVIMAAGRRQRAVRNIRQRANDLELSLVLKNRLAEMLGNGQASAVNPLYLPLFYDSSDREEANREQAGAFFDYLPGNSLVVLDDPPAIVQGLEETENGIDRVLLKAREEHRFFLEKDVSYLLQKALLEGLSALQQLSLEDLVLGPEVAGGRIGADDTSGLMKIPTATDLDLKGAQRNQDGEEGLLAPLAERIRGWIGAGYLVVLVCAGEKDLQRMSYLLERYHLSAATDMPATALIPEIENRKARGGLILVEGRITRGFRIDSLRVVIVGLEEIFGKKISRGRPRPAREGYFLRSFGELGEGDYVVHTDHGIGAYRGLQKLTVVGIANDYLVIEYQEKARLYIPVDRLHQIQRYIGPEGFAPKIDKLGGLSWEIAKEKVKKSIRDLAEELVSIYAAREVLERQPFTPPDRAYEEFCSTFEFEETPDQVRTIEDVLADMDGAKPMDRLVCGDAGFGKTEVALRASFRCAMDGRQVALLVPTTLLAEQHYQNFLRRLRDYPLRIEVLNRMKTKTEQQRIVEGINGGAVDIVIGTHRILQKDIAFKDLGLVIIDEEQRFGVAHKEKLKKLKTLVDVLTLSATPIPRTLHLSLVGIRDLSIINTPPEDRQPIRTHVLEFDEDVIRDAIRQELQRDGQVFLLHDRVRSIYTMARLVERLVPEAVVSVVHGQMKGKDIENAMARFIRRESNVLVCTSIVGSGLDIPTANTIIINRADRFGLAQLYQIRGRVGRSREEASAYLLVPRGAMLSAAARKRLSAIMEFSDPGSSFRIASKDLEIRGAGNMLGANQSGHISAVGYELYTELMENTIRELKGEAMPDQEIKPEIQLGIPAFIPEDYMPDVRRRLVTYKRASLAADEGELDAIRMELADCFGFLPAEVENLLSVIGIRNLLKDLRGKKMVYDGKQMLVFLREDSTVEPAKISELSRRRMKGLRITPDFTLSVPIHGLKGGEVIAGAKELLEALVMKPPYAPFDKGGGGGGSGEKPVTDGNCT